MDTAKHTPGPWRLRETVAIRLGQHVSALAVYGPGEYDIVFPKAGGIVDADARLIAAAPELLAAAKDAVCNCRRCDGTGRAPDENALAEARKTQAADYSMDCPDCSGLRAAIAAATGEG